MPIRNRSQFAGPTVMFITTTVAQWEPLFASPSVRDAVEEILFGCVDVSGSALMAYCIMHHHVHLVAGHTDGGPGLSKFVGGFKSLVSRRLFPEREGIWIRRFDDVVLKSEDVFRTKMNYIHENPVRAKLATEPNGWKWSSARFWLLDE
ncbi:MAG: transposase [candidate division Zixibacteria bacterium]|nr:transposase [candidate division Zixibacteria bacterium]